MRLKSIPERTQTRKIGKQGYPTNTCPQKLHPDGRHIPVPPTYGSARLSGIRPHLDYGDVIYHNQRADLMNLIERVQYKAALIVSGCWLGTSREK